MLTMWNLAIHGVTITMSRVLLDVDFNDQTTTNHALNSDWFESVSNNLTNNRSFELIEGSDYCMVHTARCGLTFTPRHFSDLTDYELEFDIYRTAVTNKILVAFQKCFKLGNDYNTFSIFFDNETINIGYVDTTVDTWVKFKLHRENDVLIIYRDDVLVYTYNDENQNTVIKQAICFGTDFNDTWYNQDTKKYNNIKLTELTVKPYIIASSTFINSGDTVALALQGDFQSCKWDNNETTTSITVEPTSTTTYTCEVVDINDNVITLSQTINVSANIVVGWGTLSENTLFVLNFANGQMNLLRGECVKRGAIDDPSYYQIEQIDGVYCLACNNVASEKGSVYSGDYFPFFNSANIWFNEAKPIKRTFEYTICTPNDDGNNVFWKALSFFQSIINTSTNTPDSNTIDTGYINIRGYQEDSPVGMNLIISDEMWDRSKPIYSNGERLPQLAKNIIGNEWSDKGWHHIAIELQLDVINASDDVCSIVMYIDGYPIKTWHQYYSTDYVARNGEWFAIATSNNNNQQWYLSECIITDGLKYGGKFDLPNNFYKQYTTIATEIVPATPVRKFSELAIVNANGTDAPIYAIVIESESLSAPICFAQSYHGFIARDHNDELREFTPSGIQINLPERTNQSGSALSFGVASINGEVLEIADTIMAGANPCYLTVLEYLPFDTSAEYDSVTAYKPSYSLTLFVTSCQVTPKGATITAGWHDTLNAKFPFKRYTAKQFKGLRYVC